VPLILAKMLEYTACYKCMHAYMYGCLGGAVVGRRTRDRRVAGSTPGRGAIKSTRVNSALHPSGYVNRIPGCMAGIDGAHSLVSGVILHGK